MKEVYYLLFVWDYTCLGEQAEVIADRCLFKKEELKKIEISIETSGNKNQTEELMNELKKLTDALDQYDTVEKIFREEGHLDGKIYPYLYEKFEGCPVVWSMSTGGMDDIKHITKIYSKQWLEDKIKAKNKEIENKEYKTFEELGYSWKEVYLER